MVKLRRAHGGCLGDQRRRRTWTAAKSSGEPLTGCDPEISEWGNPSRDYLPARGEFITVWQPSQGTETSKYLDERKAKSDSLSSGERRGKSLNLISASMLALLIRGCGILWREWHISQRVTKSELIERYWKAGHRR